MIFSLMEARTADGKVFHYRIPHETTDEEKKKIAEAFEKVSRVSVPVSRKSCLTHGAYGMYSRYDIRQYDYGGGDEDGCGGFIEVLHIKDAPEGRAKFVVHEYGYPNLGEVWSEWKSLEDARKARKKGGLHHGESDKKFPGFIRYVSGGILTPWFCAVGDEELLGDFAVGNGIEDDSVFRLGSRWVVEEGGVPEIKICMGCRFIDEMECDSYSGHETRRRRRIVYWDNGSFSEEMEDPKPGNYPRPLRDDELWIEEASRQFREILCGRQTSFRIPFADGSEFRGRRMREKSGRDPAGEYWAEVTLDGEKSRKGKVTFAPTEEFPTVALFIRGKLRKDLKPGVKIAKIKVKSAKLIDSGKKWEGAFYDCVPPAEK